MAQTVLLTLTTAGPGTGPFDLYSNVDGYTAPFETNITKSQLTVGYTSVVVPNAATIVRIKSKGSCTTYVDITIVVPTTTTTTECPCASYLLSAPALNSADFSFIPCESISPISITLRPNTTSLRCIQKPIDIETTNGGTYSLVSTCCSS